MEPRARTKKPISFSAMTSPMKSPIKIHQPQTQKYNLQFSEKSYQKHEGFLGRPVEGKQINRINSEYKGKGPYIFKKDLAKSGRFKKFENSILKNQNFFKQLDHLDKMGARKLKKGKSVKKNDRTIDFISKNINSKKHIRVQSSNLNAIDIRSIHKNLLSNNPRNIKKI
jgi:hypothetical protein